LRLRLRRYSPRLRLCRLQGYLQAPDFRLYLCGCGTRVRCSGAGRLALPQSSGKLCLARLQRLPRSLQLLPPTAHRRSGAGVCGRGGVLANLRTRLAHSGQHLRLTRFNTRRVLLGDGSQLRPQATALGLRGIEALARAAQALRQRVHACLRLLQRVLQHLRHLVVARARARGAPSSHASTDIAAGSPLRPRGRRGAGIGGPGRMAQSGHV
jgi:hypothetical protein